VNQFAERGKMRERLTRTGLLLGAWVKCNLVEGKGVLLHSAWFGYFFYCLLWNSLEIPVSNAVWARIVILWEQMKELRFIFESVFICPTYFLSWVLSNYLVHRYKLRWQNSRSWILKILCCFLWKYPLFKAFWNSFIPYLGLPHLFTLHSVLFSRLRLDLSLSLSLSLCTGHSTTLFASRVPVLLFNYFTIFAF